MTLLEKLQNLSLRDDFDKGFNSSLGHFDKGSNSFADDFGEDPDLSLHDFDENSNSSLNDFGNIRIRPRTIL